MSNEKVLEVKNLKTVFKSRGQEVQAVRGVEFTVEKGEIMGLVGESGSGKSVTMKAVIGILPENMADCRVSNALFRLPECPHIPRCHTEKTGVRMPMSLYILRRQDSPLLFLDNGFAKLTI